MILDTQRAQAQPLCCSLDFTPMYIGSLGFGWAWALCVSRISLHPLYYILLVFGLVEITLVLDTNNVLAVHPTGPLSLCLLTVRFGQLHSPKGWSCVTASSMMTGMGKFLCCSLDFTPMHIDSLGFGWAWVFCVSKINLHPYIHLIFGLVEISLVLDTNNVLAVHPTGLLSLCLLTVRFGQLQSPKGWSCATASSMMTGMGTLLCCSLDFTPMYINISRT